MDWGRRGCSLHVKAWLISWTGGEQEDHAGALPHTQVMSLDWGRGDIWEGEGLKRPDPSLAQLYNPTPTLTSSSTAIGLRKYRIPSDLRSQAEYRLVSTTVGDHVGILGAVVFGFWQPSMVHGLGEFPHDSV